MLNVILQLLITIFGIAAIFLLSTKGKWTRLGFVSGLVSDVFWIWWILITGAYIFLVFTAVRILCYLNGVRNYYFGKGDQTMYEIMRQFASYMKPEKKSLVIGNQRITHKEKMRELYIGEYYETK